MSLILQHKDLAYKRLKLLVHIYIQEGLIRFAAFPWKWPWAEPDALMETYYSHKKSHLACTRLSHVNVEATSRHVWEFPSRDEEKPPQLYVSKQILQSWCRFAAWGYNDKKETQNCTDSKASVPRWMRTSVSFPTYFDLAVLEFGTLFPWMITQLLCKAQSHAAGPTETCTQDHQATMLTRHSGTHKH